MNVLVITNLFPNPFEVNRGVFIFQQLRRLSLAARIKVLSPVAWFPFKRCVRNHTLSWEGIDVTYVRYFYTPKVMRYLYGFFLALALFPHVFRLRGQFEIIYALWAYPDGFAAWILSKIFHRPIVISVRGSDINVLCQNRPLQRLITQSLRGSNRILAVSARLKARIHQLGIEKQRIFVVRNGVDASRFSLRPRDRAIRAVGLDATKKNVIYIGALRPIKGIATLIRAFEVVIRKGGRDFHLTIIGDGELRREIQAFAQRSALLSHLRIVGTVPHDQIPLWMNAADMLVLPSYHEGCPNVIIEALACGLPVVATAVGGAQELITGPHLGILVTPKNDLELADAIIAAGSTSWDRSALHLSSSRSWEEVASDVKAHLIDVLNFTASCSSNKPGLLHRLFPA